MWGDPDEEEDGWWVFTAQSDGSYRLVLAEKDPDVVDPVTDAVMSASVGTIGDRLYMDITPEEPPIGNDFYKSHLVPGHSLTDSHPRYMITNPSVS